MINKNTGRHRTFDDAIPDAHIRSAQRRQRVTLAMLGWLAVCIGVVLLAWFDPAGVL